MEHKKLVTTHELKVYDVICDSCGESCMTDYGPNAMKLKADWGFTSSQDGERWEADLCEKCVKKRLLFIRFNKSGY